MADSMVFDIASIIKRYTAAAVTEVVAGAALQGDALPAHHPITRHIYA